MSLELKDDERFYIEYYEGLYSPYVEDSHSDGEYKRKHYEEKVYADWLNEQLGIYIRLLNVIRHPDMNRNILIHYFAVLKE